MARNSNRLKKPKNQKGSKVKLSQSSKEEFEKFDYPVFCLKNLQKGFDLDEKEDSDIAFVKRIRKLSTLSWHKIHGTQRHGFGTEKISQDSIKPQLPSIISDDTKLHAFRYNGNLPFVGFKNKNGVFHVLWIEHDYDDLYDH